MTVSFQFFEDWDDESLEPVWDTKVGFQTPSDNLKDQAINDSLDAFQADLDSGAITSGDVFLVAMRVTDTSVNAAKRASKVRRRRSMDGTITEHGNAKPTDSDMPDL